MLSERESHFACMFLYLNVLWGRNVVESESYLYIYKPTHVIRSELKTKPHKIYYLFFMVSRNNLRWRDKFYLRSPTKAKTICIDAKKKNCTRRFHDNAEKAEQLVKPGLLFNTCKRAGCNLCVLYIFIPDIGYLSIAI
jgi:hypothetical protein